MDTYVKSVAGSRRPGRADREGQGAARQRRDQPGRVRHAEGEGARRLGERLTEASGRGAPRVASTRRPVTSFLPILGWLPRYDRSWLRADVLAGVAVTALIVPKNLGYAGIAGVPLENGLYAAAAGAIIYALFCTSRHISTGPSSSLAAVAGGAVLATSVGGDAAAELVAAITLVTGILFLLFAVFRLGWIAQFLSKAVITGFLAGAAVDVVIGELPKLTGTSSEGDNAWRELWTWFQGLGDIHWTTLLVGARRARRDPRAAIRRPEGSRRARARRRRPRRVVALRPRRARRRARRRRPARAARARRCRTGRSSRRTTRRS